MLESCYKRKSFIFVICLALMPMACVKRAPRNQTLAATDSSRVTESDISTQDPGNDCGLLCRSKLRGEKARDYLNRERPDRGGDSETRTRRSPRRDKDEDAVTYRPVREKSGDGVYHTVKKGETLWRICQTYGADLAKVVRANDLDDPTAIEVGQRIWIPGAAEVMAVQATTASQSKSDYSPTPTVVPNIDPSKTKGTLLYPIPGGQMSSRFGPRNGKMHEGVDILAEEGTPILAADDGKVVYVGELRGYGNVVIIKHAGNLATVYAHNKANLVKQDELVKRGRKIAKVGQTGKASTPHLHFEVRYGEQPVDPELYLP